MQKLKSVFTAAYYELNMAAFLKGIKEESVRYINKSIDFCHELGGEVITVAPVSAYVRTGSIIIRSPFRSHAKYLMSFLPTLRSCFKTLDYIQGQGCSIFETASRHIFHHPQQKYPAPYPQLRSI